HDGPARSVGQWECDESLVGVVVALVAGAGAGAVAGVGAGAGGNAVAGGTVAGGAVSSASSSCIPLTSVRRIRIDLPSDRAASGRRLDPKSSTNTNTTISQCHHDRSPIARSLVPAAGAGPGSARRGRAA